MVPFQRMDKIPEQKWYHFRKCSKFPNKNGTILYKAQKCPTKMVPFKGGVQAYFFEKLDFELGVDGEGHGKSGHFGGSFGSIRAMLPM